jgi:hypothetical protein
MPNKFSVPLKLIELDNQSFHLLVEAEINHTPLNLIIDTGASRTVFDRKILVKRIKGRRLEMQNVKSAGIMADQIKSRMAIAEIFRIGDLELKNYQVIMIDLDAINKLYLKLAGEKIHGLLGSDFLLKMRARIDYKKLVLVMRKLK